MKKVFSIHCTYLATSKMCLKATGCYTEQKWLFFRIF